MRKDFEGRSFSWIYLGGPNVITTVFIREGSRKVREGFEDAGFEDREKGSQAKESGQPLEIEKIKKADSPLESPEGTKACRHIFRLLPPIMVR